MVGKQIELEILATAPTISTPSECLVLFNSVLNLLAKFMAHPPAVLCSVKRVRVFNSPWTGH